MNHEIVARIKGSLNLLERAFELEPLIFIDDKGNYWLNGHAEDFISRRKIPVKDFMEWLMIGSSHLQNLSYGEVAIHMMRLPEDSVIVFLKAEKPGVKNSITMLTPKQREVLGFVVKGFSNRKIAQVMKIAPGTVNSHLDKIYVKLGCSNRVAAGFLGLKNGLFLPARDRPSMKKP